MKSRNGLALAVMVLLAACEKGAAQNGESGSAPKALAAAGAPSNAPGRLEQGASATAESAPYPPRWAPELELESIAKVEQRLQAVEADGFGELSKEGSIATPQSCVEWSRLHREGNTTTTTLEEQPDGAARIRCGARATS